MIHQYIYKATECGLAEWPSGTLRLDGIEVTEDPNAADVFVCPGPLLLFQNPTDLDRFPYIAGREERHIFFDCSDYDTIYTRKNCIFIRCNLKRFMLEAHPHSIAWPWPVDDFSAVVPVPESGFKFDVSFQGWISSEARRLSVASVINSGLNVDVAQYSDFCGYIYETGEGKRRRKEFRRSMQESRIALCPESIPGCLPYRFYEAMSAARVPLLVGSDYNLPFTDEIPYSSFSIVCPRDRAETAGQVATEFLKSHTDEQIIEMGILARYWWKRLLDSRDWPQLHSYAVQNKLRVLQAA